MQGYKKQGYLLLSTQAAIGKGTRKSMLKAKRRKLMLPYVGHSYSTRMLFAGVPKKLYEHNDEVIHTLLRSYAASFSEVLSDGFSGPDGKTWYLVNLGCVGDWPALVKTGKLKRSFYSLPKTKPSAKAKSLPKGICHKCHAGQRGVPWESMAIDAEWADTEHETEAWEEDGELLSIVDYAGCRGEAYKQDVWHGWELGAGKPFLASTIVMSLDLFNCSSIDKKLADMNDHLATYLSNTKVNLSFNGLTRAKLGWEKAKQFPIGNWQKASDTITVMSWVISLLEDPIHAEAVNKHPVLPMCLQCARMKRELFSSLHEEGFFVYGPRAVELGTLGMAFLQLHQAIVFKCFELNINRFMQMPKIHMVAHSFKDLYNNGINHGVAVNPLAEAVPLSEDFIGRVSRQSRRVGPRAVMARTLDSYLIKLRRVWNDIKIL
jgi:hypothetical protein